MNGNVISRPSGSLPTPTGQSLIGGDVDASSTGPWSLGARAGDFVYVAGMRGINPSTGSWGLERRDTPQVTSCRIRRSVSDKPSSTCAGSPNHAVGLQTCPLVTTTQARLSPAPSASSSTSRTCVDTDPLPTASNSNSGAKVPIPRGPSLKSIASIKTISLRLKAPSMHPSRKHHHLNFRGEKTTWGFNSL